MLVTVPQGTHFRERSDKTCDAARRDSKRLRGYRQLNRLMRKAGMHVLIIEDEVMIAMEVEYLLAELGYETFDIAMTPSEAVACALRCRPDLITADYRILEGTGIEAVAAILALMGNVPVVYVTGNRELVVTHTTAPVVEKPISARELAKACRLACGD